MTELILQPIKVAMLSGDGVVAYVGNELKGYGNLIIVKHSNGFITASRTSRKFFCQREKN